MVSAARSAGVEVFGLGALKRVGNPCEKEIAPDLELIPEASLSEA